MVSVKFLFLPLGLPLFLFLVSTLSFAVPVLSISVSTSPFSGLSFDIFSKGSNSDTLLPPIESHTKQPLGFVSYFYLWDCFGIVINFERPKIENSSHLNWIHQKRDEHGTWIKNKVDY
ncbi:MAG TPA: hypothetical protein IAB72_00515 [Candidatus Onthoplasma faecipullorum]|nr:hypothetical protein [Candidatus Onthoplasma faecipullorum]